MSVLALCPSRGRPAAARETLASFTRTRRDPASRLAFIVDADDPTKDEYPADYTTVIKQTGSMAGALATAVRDSSLMAAAAIVGMIGDDNRFVSPGWDVAIAEALTAPGIAYGDDGHAAEHLANRGHVHPTSWWLSRQIVERLGMALPELRHFYMDDYWYELGTAAGCLRYLPAVKIEHLHPLWGTAPVDGIYQRSERYGERDKMTFHHWKVRGKSRDLAILRSIMRGSEPRKVFADWHHPALWESLRILFEDRFGWQLYSPIGPEWKSHGFIFTHDDWTADDYLTFPDAKLAGDHWERVEPEYPDHRRKLVTWQQANAMRWDYVLASVALHQDSFAGLSDKWGARLIHQIGNARYQIDRRSQVLTLASVALPRHLKPRGPCVVYHQEFDRKVFSHTPIGNPERVSSFMLRMNRSSCEWQWMADAKGVKWSSWGGEDPRAEGYLVPMSRVADEMRRSGWVWHDKKIGDGYGHVLHNAAAMGRPLIGHASHYTGRLGEPLWRDLETCIDLDKHKPVEALRLFRAIGNDPEWHAEMSANLAAEFAKRVNFDAEAEQIKAVLA
jgi:hypothetical protein